MILLIPEAWGVMLLHTATGSWALPSILSVSVGYLLLESSLLTHPFLRVSQAFHDYLVKIVFIGTNLWLGYTVWHRKECSILRKPCGGSTVSMLVGGDLRTLWMTHHWVTDQTIVFGVNLILMNARSESRYWIMSHSPVLRYGKSKFQSSSERTRPVSSCTFQCWSIGAVGGISYAVLETW